ncbi:MAG: hypothetical protein Q7J16_04350 [Candidatus Cloacimonadales bacterium]|nr:hypothetical protein [Candidatus Cloacimonadales bacterium]
MGKLLVIIILMVTAVFATLSITINKQKMDAPELVSTSMSQIKAKNTSNEGIHYAMKQIYQGNISPDQFVEIAGSHFTQTFSNFDVLDGTIDSISYVMNSTVDTLTITCYASSVINGKLKHYSSSALLHYTAGISAKTFICSKGITMNGNAEINGEKEENASMNFQATFGKTMAQMKSLADHYYKNPSTNISPVNGITYVDFTSSSKKLQLSNWTGEGILIVDGSIQMSGWAEFNGVLWVEGGNFKTSGHGTVNGAVFVNTNNTVQMTGNSVVNENETIVNNLLGSQSSSSTSLEVISWIN